MASNSRLTNELALLRSIYSLVPVGAETVMGVDQVRANSEASLGDGHASRYVAAFADQGILKRRYEMVPVQGKVSYWTLLMSEQEAIDLVTRLAAERQAETTRKRSEKAKTQPNLPRLKPQPVVVTEDPKEETKAIAGPDAPTMADIMPKAVKDLRKDEAGALIEAARQYASRHGVAQSKLQELADTMASLGISFDMSKASEAISFEKEDPRLEAIALVLPVIDRLERTNERLTVTVEELRPRAAAYDRTKADNDRLVRRVEGLVSQKVTNVQAHA